MGISCYLVLCDALCDFENGFAAFRLMSVCRRARDDAALVAARLRKAKRTLLNTMAYLQAEQILLPGFEPMDALTIAMRRLTIWDPPAHISVWTQPPRFMQDAFNWGGSRNMGDWIWRRIGPEDRDPIEALRALNPALHERETFQAFVRLLRHANAEFLYSPIVYSLSRPIQDQLVPGPGLVIVMRFESFPVAICARYTTAYYMEVMFLPWYEARAEQDDI